MELVVDLGSGTVALADAHDTGRFSVRVAGEPGPSESSPPGAGAPAGAVAGPGALDRLGRVLADAGAGRVGEGGDAWILPGAVRRLAGAAADGGWEAQFAAMSRLRRRQGLDRPGRRGHPGPCGVGRARALTAPVGGLSLGPAGDYHSPQNCDHVLLLRSDT